MYLGIDGGGTKTAFLLIDSDGSVLAEHETSGSYYLEIGVDAVKGLVDAGIDAVLDRANATVDEIDYAFLGLPAFGEDSALTDELRAVPDRRLSSGTYSCDNDMVCAWAGSLGCQDGVNLIAGTGSIGFGRYNGRMARCGGWGELFGDEGSAYWVARKGLKLFSKMSDGRAKEGQLLEIVRQRYNLTQDLDLSTLVLGEWGSDRAKIASFSRHLSDAAEQGDEQVRDIFRDAARELVEHAEALRSLLKVPADCPLPISFSGGVFKSGLLVSAPFEEMLLASPSSYVVNQPKYSPVHGAALFAAVLDDCDSIKSMLSIA